MQNDIKIRGTVSVVVDAVDIEQAQIESPAVLKESPAIKAMLAARAKDSFKVVLRACERSGHTLEYDDYVMMSLGRYEVIFKAREKNPDEIREAAHG